MGDGQITRTSPVTPPAKVAGTKGGSRGNMPTTVSTVMSGTLTSRAANGDSRGMSAVEISGGAAAAAAGRLGGGQCVAADRGDRLVAEGDAIEANVAQPPVERRRAGRPARGRGTVGWWRMPAARTARVSRRRWSPGPRARRRCRSSAPCWRDRAPPRSESTGSPPRALGSGLAADLAVNNGRRAEALRVNDSEQPRRLALAEVEDRTRRARGEVQPSHDGDGVLAGQRGGGQLHVAAVAGQQQHTARRASSTKAAPAPRSVAWSWFLDESSALPLNR